MQLAFACELILGFGSRGLGASYGAVVRAGSFVSCLPDIRVIYQSLTQDTRVAEAALKTNQCNELCLLAAP
jgi:hypothetical protein